MTPTASLAVKSETGTVSAVALAGRVKLLTAGAVTSGTGLLTVTVTEDDCFEFPALSYALAIIV